MDTLQISFGAPDGDPGIDCDPYNPLARALRSLLQTGRPFKRLLACYFDPSPIAAGLRWFGTFVFSDGGRTIFFPGLRDRQHLTRTAKGGSTPIEHQFEAEHFSLERDRREWHVTDSGKDEHKGRFPTVDLGEGRVLWFGLSLASPDALRVVKRSTEIDAQIPPGDSRRRADVLTQAREGILFNTLLLSECQPKIGGFCHFAVIAGPHGFAPYRGDKLGVPFGSPFVAPPLGNLQGLFLRSHRLSLEPHVDLEIVTALLPGRVIVPAAITSPVV